MGHHKTPDGHPGVGERRGAVSPLADHLTERFIARGTLDSREEVSWQADIRRGNDIMVFGGSIHRHDADGDSGVTFQDAPQIHLPTTRGR